MKKLLVLAILVLASTTFASMIPIPNGDYAFITNTNEKIIIMVSDYNLTLKNSQDKLLEFKQKNFKGETVYSDNSGNIIYFQDLNSCTLITKNKSYILKNLHP